MRLLLVEDDAMLGTAIRTGLQQDGRQGEQRQKPARHPAAEDCARLSHQLRLVVVPDESAVRAIARADDVVLAWLRGQWLHAHAVGT